MGKRGTVNGEEGNSKRGTGKKENDDTKEREKRGKRGMRGTGKEGKRSTDKERNGKKMVTEKEWNRERGELKKRRT